MRKIGTLLFGATIGAIAGYAFARFVDSLGEGTATFPYDSDDSSCGDDDGDYDYDYGIDFDDDCSSDDFDWDAFYEQMNANALVDISEYEIDMERFYDGDIILP